MTYKVKVLTRRNKYLGNYLVFRIDAYKNSKDNNIFCIDTYKKQYRETTCNDRILAYFDTLQDAISATMDDVAERLCEIYKDASFDIDFLQGKEVITKHYEFQILKAI